MQTFSTLLSSVRATAFPYGEAQNLVDQHNLSIVEAMIEIQRWVECYQFNNFDVIQNCAEFFQCGTTVFSAPKGNIFRVSTYDRINPTSGAEDPEAAINYCSEVIYEYVEYARLRKIVDDALCGRCSLPSPLSCGYPVPTNAQYQGYPKLPVGFEYPQASLDRTGNCVLGRPKRAFVGVWAYNNGRIYMAPWLQHTEVAAIQWNGIKRTWSNSDYVPSSAEYVATVRAYMLWKHYSIYERDQEMAAINKAAYDQGLAFLIRDCRNETRDHSGEPSLAKQNLTSLQEQSVGPITNVPLEAPTDLVCEVVSDTEINLQWQYGLTNQQGFLIEQLFTTDDVEEWIRVAVTGTETSYAMTGLAAETEYSFRVRAYNVNGGSEPSDASTCTTEEQTEQYNVAFKSTATTKTGSAAIGEDGDYWNTFGAAQGAAPLQLRRADNTISDVTISDTGVLGGTFGTNSNVDPMVKNFFSLQSSPYQKSFTIEGLDGDFDLYLYGWSNQSGANGAGRWQIYINGIQWPNGSAYFEVANNNNAPPWSSGGNYVRLNYLTLTPSDTLTITAVYVSGTRYGVISGLQLLKI